MISRQLLRTILTQTEHTLQTYRDLIDDQAHFFIFPFTLQGCINVTETGIKPEALYINDYTYFSKVISGDLPIVATWEESTYFIGEAKRWKFMQNEMGARKKYVVGRYLKGALEADIQGMMILSNQASGTEMTNLQESQELSLLVNSKLEREDIFKLLIIKRFDSLDNYAITPDTDIKGLLDRNAVQYLYVREARNFYSYSGRYCYSKLVFESLNDKLVDTGYSIANYVQPAFPGSG